MNPDKGYLSHKALLSNFYSMMKARGYQVFIHAKSDDRLGSGAIVTVVDPVEQDMCFGRFYTWDELVLIHKSYSMFWRYF